MILLRLCLCLLPFHSSLVAEYTPLSLTRVSGLSFGSITRLSPRPGAAGSNGYSSRELIQSGDYGPARWRLIGEPYASISVSFPANGEVYLRSGEHAMAIDDFKGTQTVALDGNGEGFISTHATLKLGANQEPGRYSAVYSVVVSYE